MAGRTVRGSHGGGGTNRHRRVSARLRSFRLLHPESDGYRLLSECGTHPPGHSFRPVARYDFPRSEFYPAAPRIGCCRHLAGIGAVRSGNYGVYRRVLPVATKRDDMIPK